MVRKVSNSFKRTAVVHYDFHVDLFEKLLYGNLEEFSEVYKSKYFDGDIDEVIEKIVILNHLDNKCIRNWINFGHDPLKYMFRGQFKHPVEELKAAFDYYNEYYKNILTRTLEKDINRIEFYSERGRSVESFEKRQKMIEERKSEYVVAHIQSALLENLKMDMIFKQIMKNIEKKRSNGESVSEELTVLELVSKGDYNTFNVKVIMKLIAEANSQLKVLKLPPAFKRLEDQFYTKVSLESFYKYMKSASIDKAEKDDGFVQMDKEGNQFMLVGPGEMPSELRGKNYQEIEKLGLETVFETPIDPYTKQPISVDQKTSRANIKGVEDIVNENDGDNS